jgi:hypothetical protein
MGFERWHVHVPWLPWTARQQPFDGELPYQMVVFVYYLLTTMQYERLIYSSLPLALCCPVLPQDAKVLQVRWNNGSAIAQSPRIFLRALPFQPTGAAFTGTLGLSLLALWAVKAKTGAVPAGEAAAGVQLCTCVCAYLFVGSVSVRCCVLYLPVHRKHAAERLLLHVNWAAHHK